MGGARNIGGDSCTGWTGEKHLTNSKAITHVSWLLRYCPLGFNREQLAQNFIQFFIGAILLLELKIFLCCLEKKFFNCFKNLIYSFHIH